MKNRNWKCRGEKMLYVLTFAGGAIFGVVMMCCFIISGQESRMEEKYLNGEQNQGDGL